MADITTFSTTFVALVAVVSLALTGLTFLAARRTGQQRIYFVSAAMAVLCLKSAIAAYALGTASIGHEHLEVLQGGFDLAMVAFLVAPFWVQP